MKKNYLYCLVDPREKYNIRYIGITNNPERRIKEHIKLSTKKTTHKDCWISNLMQQRTKPELIILEESFYKEVILLLEIFAISKCLSLGFHLTNSTTGGENSYTFTEEVKKKISINMIGEKNHRFGKKDTEERKLQKSIFFRGRIPWNKGIPTNEETKEKMRKAQSGPLHPNWGKKRSTSTIEKLKKNSKSKPFKDQNGTIYNSLKEAADLLKLDKGNIQKILKGKGKQYKGYKFFYI